MSRNPSTKKELLEGLARNPDKFSNSSKTPLIALIDSREAAEKIKRSSEKHKSLSLSFFLFFFFYFERERHI
jgi:hypothetical protein